MNSLGASTEALTAALDEEHRLCSTLLDLSVREEEAILSGDVAVLTALVDEQEQLLELLATLETERMTALTAIAGASGLDADSITLTQVATLAGGRRGEVLQTTGAALREVADSLQQANTRNAELLRSSRELIERWIQYLRNVVSGSLTYNPAGSTQGALSARVLDRTA